MVANVANVYVAIIRTAQRAGFILHSSDVLKLSSTNWQQPRREAETPTQREINKSSWRRSDISSDGRQLDSVCYQCCCS